MCHSRHTPIHVVHTHNKKTFAPHTASCAFRCCYHITFTRRLTVDCQRPVLCDDFINHPSINIPHKYFGLYRRFGIPCALFRGHVVRMYRIPSPVVFGYGTCVHVTVEVIIDCWTSEEKY